MAVGDDEQQQQQQQQANGSLHSTAASGAPTQVRSNHHKTMINCVRTRAVCTHVLHSAWHVC